MTKDDGWLDYGFMDAAWTWPDIVVVVAVPVALYVYYKWAMKQPDRH